MALSNFLPQEEICQANCAKSHIAADLTEPLAHGPTIMKPWA